MDLNDDITFRGMWQTMSRKGGITIPVSIFMIFFYSRRILFFYLNIQAFTEIFSNLICSNFTNSSFLQKWKFNYGFFIVFVVKGDDLACNDDTASNVNRLKSITFKVMPTLNENSYFNAVTVTLACIVVFYIIFTISLFVCNRRCYVPRTMAFVNNSEAGTPTDLNGTTPNSILITLFDR